MQLGIAGDAILVPMMSLGALCAWLVREAQLG
jgi:hypothetical protein